MILVAIRQAVADAIRAALPQLVACSPHAGRFESAEEVKRLATRGLTVLVGVLGLDGLDEESGEVVGEAVFAAYVLAPDKGGAPRDAQALATAASLARIIAGNCWGQGAVESAPTRLRADNLYNASLDKLGLALWAVSWRQRVNLGSADDLSGLDLFEIFDARYGQGADGAPAAEDLVRLPQED